MRDPKNEGEGNRTADRKYRDDVEEFIEHEDPEERAREAERDIERDPGKYEDAEEEGKRPSAGEAERDKDLI